MRQLFFLLAACLTLATSASAAWPPGGKLVSSPAGVYGTRNVRITESPSGDLFVLGVGVGGNSNYYVMQRLTRDGELAPGWPADGVPFSVVIKGAPLRTQSIVVDDASRTWHSWAWSTSFLQSIDGSGAAAPVPSGTSYNIGSGATVAHAAPAPGGEVFVTSSGTRLKRLTADGTAAAGWLSTGVALPGTSFDDNAILPDGNGGVVVIMRTSATTGLPIATRIDGDGVRHTGWAAGGLALSSVLPPAADITGDMQLLPSGSDHALAVWSVDAGSGTRRLMMQRFGLDGTLDPLWPADGLEAVAPDTLSACRALADRAGGAFVVRQSHGRPVASHVTAAGTMLASNVEYVDAAAQYIPTHFTGGAPLGIPDDMIADVTADGRLLVGWNDTRLSPAVSFRLRWLTPALSLAPGTPDTGLVFFPGSPHQLLGSMVGLRADGTSGAFIAWGDYHGDFPVGDLWMAYVQMPVTVGVEPPAARSALSLSAPRPNPARADIGFDLALPDDSPARVELLDVAGRVLRTQFVEGAGPHTVTFDALASFPPGLYFARATSRAGSKSVRVVVNR